MSNVPGGGFLVARKMFTSEIWMKDPLYLKLWLWLIGRACWQDHEKGGYTYRRGEIVTTYNEIRESLVYFHNRRKNSPTQKKIRVMFKWLENNQMIRVEPLKTNSQKAASAQLAEPCQTGAYTTPSTRAHHGIKIIVVNYDSYQTLLFWQPALQWAKALW